MDLKEFANELVEILKKNPTFEQIDITVQRILTAQINGTPVNQKQIDEILDYMDEKIGNFRRTYRVNPDKELPSYMEIIREKVKNELEK